MLLTYNCWYKYISGSAVQLQISCALNFLISYLIENVDWKFNFSPIIYIIQNCHTTWRYNQAHEHQRLPLDCVCFSIIIISIII